MNDKSKTYKIGEVATLAKVSVRTLHHYDAIGLLSANGRSDSGYRLYTQSDLERLQQILFYKALEFSLEEIQKLLSAPTFDRNEALLQQRELINEKSDQLQALLTLINKTIDEMDEEIKMSTEEMFEVFPDTTQEHLDEAENRWGESEPFKESKRRQSQYSKDDLQAMKTENDAVNEDFATLMDANVPAGDSKTIAIAERARLSIDKWHYPCSKAFHLSLSEMYVADERFKANYEKIHAGLAVYIHEAVKANARI